MSYQANSVGEAQWKDFLPTDVVVPAGANAPDRIAMPGMSLIDVWCFDGTTTIESLCMSFELNHEYKEGSDIYPHVHWCGSNASGGNVVWSLSYTIGSINNGEMPAIQTIKTPAENNPGLGANGRPIIVASEFPAIPGAGLKVGDVIRCRLFRDPDDDTYGHDAILLAAGIHVDCDTQGSRQRFVK